MAVATENRAEVGAAHSMRLTPGEMRQLLGTLDQKIKRVRVGLFYRFSLLLVALAMVALPLVYLSIIGLAGLGLFYHATHSIVVFQEMEIRGALVTYGAPLVIGGLLIFFLLKPLLAPRELNIPPLRIKREEQPLLFNFIERLCAAVGAPKPSLIQVDCDVNASASFRRGFFNFLRGNVVLTIGLPLAASLQIREFVGVLAHEFGHFGQGGGMRLTYIIRHINAWFARVVYQRDRWDARLQEWTRALDIRIAWIFWIARLFIWLSRKVLWVLMYVGHIISSQMLRQMEYDADRYEARISGSDTYESTMKKIILFSFAQNKAQHDLQQAWSERRLADNLPLLIYANGAHMPAKVASELLDEQLKQRTGIFDSHPAPRTRIKKAQRENAPGIVRDERPARLLFEDFEELCKTVTVDFYRGILGQRVQEHNLVPTTDMMGETLQRGEAQQAAGRYLHNLISVLLPLELTPQDLTPPSDPRAVARELQDCRGWLAEQSKDLEQGFRYLVELDRMRLTGLRAQALLEAKFKIRAKDFGMNKSDAREATALIETARQHDGELREKLQPINERFRARFNAVFRLLRTPQIRQRVPEADAILKEVTELYDALRRWREIHEPLLRLDRARAALQALLSNYEGNEKNEQLVKQIKKVAGKAEQHLNMIYTDLSSADYPFEHAGGKLSIAHWILEVPPRHGDIGHIYACCDSMLEKLFQLYYRCISQLALHAEKIEEAMGLKPVPPPERKQAEAE